MLTQSAVKKTLALTCVAGLLAAAPLALAGEEGYLGVVLQNITPSMAKALQLDEGQGILVNEVVEGSPAAEAGLQAGDVILLFGGQDLDGDRGLTKAVRNADPGDEVDVVVLRGGDKRTITVKVGEREDDFAWFGKNDGDKKMQVYRFNGEDHDFDFDHEDHNVWVQRFDGDDETIEILMKGMQDDRGFLGVHLDDLDGQLGEYFDVEDGEGALITEVVEDTPAAAAGLQAGDVIVRIGDQEIDSAMAVHKALADTDAGQEVKIEFSRKGKGKSVDVTLAEAPEQEFMKKIEFLGDGDNYHIVAPKMMHRMPHLKHQMRIHANPHMEIHELRVEDEELDQMREELDKLRDELQEMREELDKR